MAKRKKRKKNAAAPSKPSQQLPAGSALETASSKPSHGAPAGSILKTAGKAFFPSLAILCVFYLFTADKAILKLMRLSPSKRTPLFNGAIECRLLEFRT